MGGGWELFCVRWFCALGVRLCLLLWVFGTQEGLLCEKSLSCSLMISGISLQYRVLKK